MKKAQIKNITITAMLCALAYVVMLVGRVPIVMFLKYDPKDIIIALGGLIWGPFMSLIVSVIVSGIEALTASETGWIGFIMNALSSCAFACTAAAIYKKKRTLSGAVIGLFAGCAVMVAAMLMWNYFITPIYMGYPREAVAEMLLPVFLPFNLLKAGLNAGFTFLMYRPIISALRKAKLVEESASSSKKKTSIGWIMLFAVIIISCVVGALVWKDII